MLNGKTTTLIAALAFAIGEYGCGGSASVEPDTSVKNNEFCTEFLKHCGGSASEFIGMQCMTMCSEGVKPTKKDDPGHLCWQVYCADEVNDCTGAGGLNASAPILDCAHAHGWVQD
jgi:hypothetical protein